MKLLRRIAGFFGISRDEIDAHGAREGSGGSAAGPEERTSTSGAPGPAVPATAASRGGFSVQVPVAVERPALGPVLVPCEPGEGGVQGFKWYTRRLRIDEDGDVANEFLDEVAAPEKASLQNNTTLPKFKVKHNTQPTAMAMRKQVIAVDGNIHQSLEYQGKLQWV
ncbi:hypothetical protein Cni_G01429 [Canna indica]|uniref:Uncharacterized protein n=1 Tax=Canna indica TaxID=4628 RepID=A0AAQ3PYN3_9LILI|nr:hypothetical protein Cni_G01429 [Canna indica]